MWKIAAGIGAYVLLIAGCWLADGLMSAESTTILNVSYDPTRHLWRDLNAAFRAEYHKQTGERLRIQQSHGGSGSQARAVTDGLDADVVTLALWSDVNAIHKKGLIDKGWVRDLAVFLDPRGLTRQRYDVQSLPTACLIDAEGR